MNISTITVSSVGEIDSKKDPKPLLHSVQSLRTRTPFFLNMVPSILSLGLIERDKHVQNFCK